MLGEIESDNALQGAEEIDIQVLDSLTISNTSLIQYLKTDKTQPEDFTNQSSVIRVYSHPYEHSNQQQLLYGIIFS